MSGVKGKVGKWQLSWKTIPRGWSGEAEVELTDGQGLTRSIAVSWRRDRDGLWIEFPHGVQGFDLRGELSDEGRRHFQVSRRESAQAWQELAFLHEGEEGIAAAGAAGGKKSHRVRAQMPGKIIRIVAAEGAQVEKDQPLLVMEAMKMENEIRAPHAGKVGALKVSEGQAVETGADLCVIEAN